MNAPAELRLDMPVRFSHLRAYGRSPAHGLHARLVEMDPTYAMQRGTAVHALLFDTRRVCGYPGKTRNGKQYDAFVEANPDSEILTMAEFDKARRMADAVRASEIAQPWLRGTIEKTIRFRWMGLECRATPDIRGPNFLTELKCSASADPVRFPRHALRMSYHAQMRMQMAACKDEIDDCVIVCVEDKAPHPVQVFRIEPRALEAGEKLLVLWAERLKNSETSRAWPPYTTCIAPIDVPDDDNDLTLIFPEE